MRRLALMVALSVVSFSTVAMAETPAPVKAEKSVQNAADKMNAAKMNAAKMNADKMNADKMNADKMNAAKMNAAKMQKTADQKIGNHKGMGGRAMAQFKKMDANNDGNVSQSEFTTFNVAKFTQKDKNKDGNLSPAELSPTLAKKMVNQKS